MPMIRETIVITSDRAGRAHIAPIGLIAEGDDWIIAPFRPSTTLDNLEAVPFATASHTDDVRVFAGCLTGRRDWPTVAADEVPVQRPRFRCRVARTVQHAPFQGFNRGQAAVVEGAILVSRLHMLPRERIERELAILQSAVDKTAGPLELEAWTWLMKKVRFHYGLEAGDPL
jgi:hypothetical protein